MVEVWCPRCQGEIIKTEQLTLCEMCYLELQAWAEERGNKIKESFLKPKI